ncbi:hypothetical protein ACJIZ3_008995 [Penstemon smallii]|uniref:Uncharacterized protein n=1 Tax=Penstemon smallii TaxID=265156 RepID=A0ABD3TBD3_9LAMI
MIPQSPYLIYYIPKLYEIIFKTICYDFSLGR